MAYVKVCFHIWTWNVLTHLCHNIIANLVILLLALWRGYVSASQSVLLLVIKTCVELRCQYLASNGVYHPLWVAFLSNPTPSEGGGWHKFSLATGAIKPMISVELSRALQSLVCGAMPEHHHPLPIPYQWDSATISWLNCHHNFQWRLHICSSF